MLIKKIFIILFFISSSSLAQTTSKVVSEKKWEIRTAPIAYLAKWITLDASYILNSNWAIGPSIVSYASSETLGGMFAPTYNGLALGLNLIVASSFVNDSFYISSHVYSENYKSYPHAFLGFHQKNGIRFNATTGHRWVYQNFSTMLGFGLENKNHSVRITPDSGTPSDINENSTSLHIEFKLGIMF